ncbi:MAG: alpha/beta hydrolase [Ruminococcaceae bacterium]|nr:alpha/beta hydrolase [Oscillospiraceae bacterium]
MDISLFYVEKGSGEPLILLHGNGEDHEYFRSQIDYFSKTRRVIAIDTRGHGRSLRGTKPFTLNTFVEDLVKFMRSKEIYNADILGFSDGGNVALMFALQHPYNVRRLILNGANLRFSGLTLGTGAWILRKYILYCIQAPFSKKAAKRRDLFRLMVKEPRIDPDELRSLEVPTLVIVGNKDMIKAGHSKLIAKNIPDCKLVTLKGDHFIAVNNSEKFNKAVEEFLTQF